MDLEAKPLQYFAAVARERSFSRAAGKLNVSQPSLSAQVRELERRLGFELFSRSSRHVELTREGRIFLPQAQQMIAEAARMNRAAKEIRQNELRVGSAIYSVLIPERVELMDAFAAEHPGVAMVVSNRDQTRLFTDLRRGDLDVAVVLGLVNTGAQPAPDAPASEIVLPSDLERLNLLEKQVELLVPAESPLAAYDRIPLDALAGECIAMLGSYHGAALIDALADPLEAAGAELIVPPEGNAIAVERFAQRARIAAICIGWFHYADQAESRDMARRAVDGFDVSIALALIRSPQGAKKPAAEAFWAFGARRNKLATQQVS